MMQFHATWIRDPKIDKLCAEP